MAETEGTDHEGAATRKQGALQLDPRGITGEEAVLSSSSDTLEIHKPVHLREQAHSKMQVSKQRRSRLYVNTNAQKPKPKKTGAQA